MSSSEIGFLALLPVCLAFAFGRVGKTVRAGCNHAGHPIAEPVSNILQPRIAALILGAVVKESCDGQILVATILQDGG